MEADIVPYDNIIGSCVLSVWAAGISMLSWLSKNVTMWSVLSGPRVTWRWRTFAMAAHTAIFPPLWPESSTMTLWPTMFLPLLLEVESSLVSENELAWPLVSTLWKQTESSDSNPSPRCCPAHLETTLDCMECAVVEPCTSSHILKRKKNSLGVSLDRHPAELLHVYSVSAETTGRSRQAVLLDIVDTCIISHGATLNLPLSYWIICQTQVHYRCFLCRSEHWTPFPHVLAVFESFRQTKDIVGKWTV